MRAGFIYFFFSLSFILVSCESLTTDVDVDDSNFTEQMIISSFIPAEATAFDFLVAKSRGFLDNGDFEQYNIQATDIRIVKESTQEEITLSEYGRENQGSSRGNYLFRGIDSTFFQPGTYTFTVEQPIFGTSETTLTLPEYAEVENIEYQYEAGSTLGGEASSSLTFDIIDDPNAVNYYQLVIYSKTNSRVIYYPSTLDPSAIAGPSGTSLLISDESFNGDAVKNLEIKFDRFYYNPDDGGELLMSWSALSEDHYLYVKSLERHQQSVDNPFNSPVQIYSNVNDALGAIGLRAEREYVVHQ